MTQDEPENTAKQNSSTPLSGYKRSKKVLTPPMATIPNIVLSSWINDRQPEMLWANLIRERHPGHTGYGILRGILIWLGDNSTKNEITGVTHTDIAQMSEQLRGKFITEIVRNAGTDALRPILLLVNMPAYGAWAAELKKMGATSVPEEDWTHLADAISKTMWHQSQEATDVRWVKLMGTILAKQVSFVKGMEDTIEGIKGYPNVGDQRSVRPSIRSMEMMDNLQDEKYTWAEKFWEYTYQQTDCLPENAWDDKALEKRYKNIVEDKAFYAKPLEELRQSVINHFFNTSKTTKIDARHETVFGITIYALDTFIENSILQTSGTVSGRATARIIFEAYITLAHLYSREDRGEPAWDGYRNYGTGQINLILRKYEDESYVSDMVNLKTMDTIANEDKWSEYVPINVGHWDESDLRTISSDLGKKDIYDKYYLYTSGYLHASWGAVREASYQSCYNPLHRLHRIPAYGLPILPNVNEDCRELLNGILGIVDKTYPDFKNVIPKKPQQASKSSKKSKS